MRRLSALLLLLPVLAFAEAPPPPSLAAKAWLLVDLSSAQTIASANPHERVEPASLTKLMTAYLAFAALKQKTAYAMTSSLVGSEMCIRDRRRAPRLADAIRQKPAFSV